MNEFDKKDTRLPTPRPTTAGTWPAPLSRVLFLQVRMAPCTTETAFGYFCHMGRSPSATAGISRSRSGDWAALIH